MWDDLRLVGQKIVTSLKIVTNSKSKCLFYDFAYFECILNLKIEYSNSQNITIFSKIALTL